MNSKVTVKDVMGPSKLLAGRPGLARAVRSPQMSAIDLKAPASSKVAPFSLLHITPPQLARLCSLPRRKRDGLIEAVMKLKPSCLVVTGGRVCGGLLDRAEAARIPVLKSGNPSAIRRLLMSKLAPRISLHGVLVEVFGLGVLIIGESAIGKSEAALDLVLRGHKLVADDLVALEKTDGEITGGSVVLGADVLQIRGLGIVDVRALYGDSAAVASTRIGLVVELEEWKKGQHYSLVGLKERRYRLLGINLPYLKLPVKPGRNMATLIEVAARNQALKNRGVYTARDFNRKLMRRLGG